VTIDPACRKLLEAIRDVLADRPADPVKLAARVELVSIFCDVALGYPADTRLRRRVNALAAACGSWPPSRARRSRDNCRLPIWLTTWCAIRVGVRPPEQSSG
jgi:hypothetical protein